MVELLIRNRRDSGIFTAIPRPSVDQAHFSSIQKQTHYNLETLQFEILGTLGSAEDGFCEADSPKK
jgi:hypothetical protein